MLEKLQTLVQSSGEPDYFARLDSVRFENSDAVLCVSVQSDLNEIEWSRWEIVATALHGYRIDKPFGDLTVWEADHVLGRQHLESNFKLYFRGVSRSALETVGRLYIAHKNATKGWIPFDRYFNPSIDLEKLLASGDGLLADGPAFLIESYARVLSGEKIEPNIVDKRPAKRWDDQQWIENMPPLITLVIGSSFFVAASFEEQELSERMS